MVISEEIMHQLIEKSIENAKDKLDDANILLDKKKYPSAYYSLFLVQEEIAKSWYLFNCLLKKEELNKIIHEITESVEKLATEFQ